MIAQITQEGLDTSTCEGIKPLKKGMQHLREINKDIQERYSGLSDQMYEMIEKEINSQLERDRLQKLLQTIHEKNLTTEEAY